MERRMFIRSSILSLLMTLSSLWPLRYVFARDAKELAGTATAKNLKQAFTIASEDVLRFTFFADQADIESDNEVAAILRSTAEEIKVHAYGEIEFLEGFEDPTTGLPFGQSKQNLHAAIASLEKQYVDMYPDMVQAAQKEGFNEVADWFQVLINAKIAQANRLRGVTATFR